MMTLRLIQDILFYATTLVLLKGISVHCACINQMFFVRLAGMYYLIRWLWVNIAKVDVGIGLNADIKYTKNWYGKIIPILIMFELIIALVVLVIYTTSRGVYVFNDILYAGGLYVIATYVRKLQTKNDN